MANPKVFMEINIGSDLAGQIAIELFSDSVPKTAKAFQSLCIGEKAQAEYGLPSPLGSALHYRNSSLIATDGGIHGGYNIAKTSNHGFDKKFEELSNVKANIAGPGILLMDPSSAPKFRISTFRRPLTIPNNTPVIGRVVEGLDVIAAAEAAYGKGAPVFIADCGEFPREKDLSTFRKRSRSEFERITASSVEYLSKSLEQIVFAKRLLTALDAQRILVPEKEKEDDDPSNNKELVELEEMLKGVKRNLDVLNHLQTELDSLEKHHKDLFAKIDTQISSIKNKVVMEAISSFPEEVLDNIEKVIKKLKTDRQ